MATLRHVVVLVVGLGLVGISGVIDAAGGPEEAATSLATTVGEDAALDPTRAQQLTPKAASRFLAVIERAGRGATRGGVPRAPAIRRLGAAERLRILGDEASVAEEFAVQGGTGGAIELSSRGGHVDLRGGTAYFRGSLEVFRSPLRPAAELSFVAEPGRRILLECEASASLSETTLTISDGSAAFEVAARDRVSLLYLGENDDEAPRPLTVTITADRPGWSLAGCTRWTAPQG